MSKPSISQSGQEPQLFRRRSFPKTDACYQTQKGDLALEYTNRDGKTVLTHSRCSYPWHYFPPLYLDHTGCATTFLTNPSGGLVGGDRLSFSALLQEHTHVLFTTPSATKIYRTEKAPTLQTIDVTVGTNAILEWIPETTIPFAGSYFDQTITVCLHSGASLILWDALAAGRIAPGERWGFSHFGNQINISLADGKTLVERYVLEPTHDKYGVPFDQEWNYVGSLFLVSAAIRSPTLETIKEGLRAVLQKNSKEILGGVSEPSVPGLVVKVMTRSAPELTSALEEMWGVVRMQLWETPPPTLRRY